MTDERSPSGTSFRRWGPTTKRGVVWALLVLFVLLVYQFRAVIPQLVVAGMLAFILEPAVRFLQRRIRLGRGAATAVVFGLVVLVGLAVLAAPVTAVPAIQRAVRLLELDFDRIITDIGRFMGEPVQVGDYTLDLSDFYGQLSTMLSRFATSVAEGTLDIVLGVASGALQVIFVLIAAIYLVKDTHRLVEGVDGLAPPGYEEDFVRLRKQVTAAWSAFLRSQLLLSMVITIITTIACAALGLPYPWALGLIAGLLEVVPQMGPVLAAVPSVVLALFFGSSYLPLSPIWLALLVVAVYLVIQQVENNVLVPRIMARGLDLHPLMVLVAVVIGGNIAGILGLLLAPPVLATIRILGRYVFHRLYDRDPWTAAAKQQSDPARPEGQGMFARSRSWLRESSRQIGFLSERPGTTSEAPEEVATGATDGDGGSGD